MKLRTSSVVLGGLVVVFVASFLALRTLQPYVPDEDSDRSFLDSGETLNPGQSLARSGYNLMMQTSGDLVLSDEKAEIWSSGTSVPESRLVMQPDGDLVILSPDGVRQWSTNTALHPGARLFIAWWSQSGSFNEMAVGLPSETCNLWTWRGGYPGELVTLEFATLYGSGRLESHFGGLCGEEWVRLTTTNNGLVTLGEGDQSIVYDCVDVIFDWLTWGEDRYHMDSRINRRCSQGTTVLEWTEPQGTNRDFVNGRRVQSVCRYSSTANVRGICVGGWPARVPNLDTAFTDLKTS